MNEKNLSVPVKLWAFICVLMAISLGKNGSLSYILTLVCFFQLALQKKWRILYSYGLFYAILGLLLYGIRYHGLHMIIFSEFYVLMFWNLSPVILTSSDLITTYPSELSAFLSKIHAPTSVILGLLVIFRFLPTMKSELKNVSFSMKNRGLMSLKNILLHPLTIGEYVLIPLLFRVLMIADQLAVSAVARGAETPGSRGSYYGRKTGIFDLAIIVLWTTFIIMYLRVGGINI